MYCFVYVFLFLFVLPVLVYGLLPPSENSIAVSEDDDDYNNNNNNKQFSNISRNKWRRQGNHIVEPTSANWQNYPQQQTRRYNSW